MALKKSELYSSLWSSCDELRGGMDASQYKDYVLVLLFIKYVSDKYAGVPYAPIDIPEGAGSSRHPQKLAACRADRDPRTRRAPSRRSAPVRPDNRAAGAADAARGDDADGPATAHRRSSNRAMSRATPNSRDALTASPPPSSGQSRNTAPARLTAPGCEPQRGADDCWVCLGAWKAGSRHRPA